jgi:hypothetical protein
VAPWDGMIYMVSKGQPGSKNDINNYNKETNQVHKYLEPDEGICADNIYKFIKNKYHHETLVPYGHEECKEDQFKSIYSNYIAIFRTMVENVFAHMKKWAICSSVFCHNLDKLDSAWLVVAILTNMKTKRKGIRGLHWVENAYRKSNKFNENNQ